MNGIVEALQEISYQGEVSLDLHGYPLPIQGSRIGIPYLKEALQKLHKDAEG